MYNSNPRRIRASTPARDAHAFWTWRGYCDGAAGVGFCPEYDTLGAGDQRNYERGRQIAIVLKANGGVPKWRKSEKIISVLNRTIGLTMTMEINELVRFFFERSRAA